MQIGNDNFVLRILFSLALLLSPIIAVAAPPLPVASPESVGFSSEGLARID